MTISDFHKIQLEKLRSPSVGQVFRLFRKQAEHFAGKKIDWKKTERITQSVADLLRQDIATAKSGGDALMNIPYALRYDSSQMWKLLDEPGKLKFKKWLGTYWAINRHCMPLVNANRIQKLFDSGQLRVVSDLENIVYDDAEKHFFFPLKIKRTGLNISST